ncbi:hypothetical protein GOC74_12320 [Halomicrobium mukohataei]|uniref:AbrB/MazE/SpoVT family DNA-binding domain-containing protein n=1 Tax=Halomicrobium mukohataei TaxID=57705 RepID=A0A847UC77_9EURY|nr:hypothetical protein [Halomicrobium mukohataei]NLV10709.1 hypothetical protein [Halomicrobium mukohataei]
MSDDSQTEIHETRKVREDGASIVVTIPQAAVERSGIEPGEQVMVGSLEDGAVVLQPWGRVDIDGMRDDD